MFAEKLIEDEVIFHYRLGQKSKKNSPNSSEVFHHVMFNSRAVTGFNFMFEKN